MIARIDARRAGGRIDPLGGRAEQVAGLARVLRDQVEPVCLPIAWSRMLEAADSSDGPTHHLDLDTALPSLDGVRLHLDSLVSEASTWQIHLRAWPGWFRYAEDRRSRWSPLDVRAEDDRGGHYLSLSGGGSARDDHERTALRFLPRLDPAATRVGITFRARDAEVVATIELEGRAP